METSEIKTKVYANGRIGGFKGKKPTPETKEKMRLARLGKIGMKRSPEAKEKMRLAHVGRKRSPETKEKMSLAKTGKKLSHEHIQKIRLANLGKKLSPETIEKVRLAHLGKTCTEPKRAKGPLHCRAVVCELRSPTNVVWYVKNITHFVRTHPELFNPEDLVMKNKKNAATSGLINLTARTRPSGSWKGWTLVSKVENYDNKGKDLLDRVLVEDANDITYPGK